MDRVNRFVDSETLVEFVAQPSLGSATLEVLLDIRDLLQGGIVPRETR